MVSEALTHRNYLAQGRMFELGSDKEEVGALLS